MIAGGLTPRQAECLSVIADLTVDDISPSYEDIAKALNLKSRSGVHRLLTKLRERGYVTWSPDRARTIRPAPTTFDPNELLVMSSAELRRGVALIAGILAHRDGEAQAARAFGNIHDRLLHLPRKARP
jgi:SOS-response transcriptional repressor LexA